MTEKTISLEINSRYYCRIKRLDEKYKINIKPEWSDFYQGYFLFNMTKEKCEKALWFIDRELELEYDFDYSTMKNLLEFLHSKLTQLN